MSLTQHFVSSSGTNSYASSTSSATPCSLTVALSSAIAGDWVCIKNDGVYTRSASDGVTNSGTTTSPILFQGYNTTPGDGYQGRTNSNGALITTNMPLIDYTANFRMTTGSVSNVIYDSLQWLANGISGVISNAGTTSGVISNCSLSSSSTAGINGISISTSNIVFNCDIIMSGATGNNVGLLMSGGGSRGIGNRILMSSANANTQGIAIASTGTALFNTCIGVSGTGIYGNGSSNQATIVGNSVAGFTDCIAQALGNPNLQCVVDNMATDSTNYGLNSVMLSTAVFSGYNRYRNNTNAPFFSTDWTTATNFKMVSAGSTTDYVNVNNDLRLLTSSPAVGAGLPPPTCIGALQTSSGGETTVSFIG